MRRVYLIAIIALLGMASVLATLSLGSVRASAERAQAEARQTHTLRVILEAERLATALQAMQRGQRGYLLTGDRLHLEPYFEGAGREAGLRASLRRQTRDNARQQANLAELDRSVDTFGRFLALTINGAASGQRASAVALVQSGGGTQRMQAVLSVLERIVGEEQRLLGLWSIAADHADRRVNQFTWWLTIAGTTLLVLATVLGATALRRHVQRAEVEHLLRSVLSSIQGAVFAKDREGRYTLMSEVGARLFGRSIKDIIGRTDAEIQPPIFAATAAENERLAADKREPTRFEESIRLDGRDVHLSVTRTMLHDLEGQIAGSAGVAIDVTAWRQNEAMLARRETELANTQSRLEQILNALPIGVVVCDAPSGAIRFGNTAVASIFRHPLRRSATVDDYYEWEAYHPDGRRVQGSDYPLAQVLERGEQTEGEVNYRRGDGSMAWLRIMGAPIRDAEGRLEGGVVAIVDVDEQRRLLEHQRLLTAELSHRVKNVLAVVQSISSATFRRATSLEGFRTAFAGRLMALSSAHALLLRTHWTNLSFLDLLEEVLAPHRSDDKAVQTRGPDFQLEPKPGVALALILHELSTNSAKHGVLAHGGLLSIDWTCEATADRTVVLLRWIESGLPFHPVMGADGLGTRLIKRSTENDLRGKAERTVGSEGLVWAFRFELDGDSMSNAEVRS